MIDASNRLVDAVATLPDEAWDAEVRTARGRAITAAEVPWMRIRESWVHAVDLGVGVSLEELPHAVVIDLLDEVASGSPAATTARRWSSTRANDRGASDPNATVASRCRFPLAKPPGMAHRSSARAR